MVVMSLTAVSIGLLVSAITRNEFQVMQMIPVIVLPQLLFSGLIPLEDIPFGLGNLAYIMPLYYTSTALKEVIVFGSGLAVIWPHLAVLLALLLGLSLLNTRVLRQFRRI